MHATAPQPEIPSGAAAADERPSRILFVITSSDFGGTESFLAEIVRRLDRREFDPVVCSLRPCGRIADAIAMTGTPVFSLHMSEEPRVRELASGALRLARRIDEYQIDLVQAFLYRANVLAGIAARLTRSQPIVVSGQRSLYPLGGKRAAIAARWTRRLSQRVVAVSPAVREELVRHEHLGPERIVVIENGVDTGRYVPLDPRPAREALEVDVGVPVIGAVGRLSREKGFHLLLDALAAVREGGCPALLLLAGDGPERESLEKQAEALGIRDQVRFLGMRGDVIPVYAACDVFALPSLEEGSPNALLEAMACGRAVVATAVGGVPSIVEHGISGLLVPVGSPAGIAASIVRLLGDSSLRSHMAAAARQRVQARHDISSAVRHHADLYSALLSAQKRPPRRARTSSLQASQRSRSTNQR